MIYNVFNKEIEIDENNKGIRFYLDEMCEDINEVCITYWYMVRKRENAPDLSKEQAAKELREMSEEELKNFIINNIRLLLDHEDYAREYAQYL